MPKKPFIAVVAVALICGGLWVALSERSFSFLDGIINPDNGDDSRVTVNVYERENATLPFADALGEDEERAVKRWFIEYDRALGELSGDVKAFSDLYRSNSPSAKADVSALTRLVEARRACSLPLTFSVCDAGLRLISAVYGDTGLVEVRVEECFAAVFDGFPDRLSAYAGREHFFTLEKVGDKWLFRLHESDSTYKGSPGQARLYPAGEAKHAAFPYEREKAAEYASAYTDREDKPRNRDFPEYGDNGMNFVSQCINAGGVPADSSWNRDTAAFYDAKAFYEYISSDNAKFAAGVCDYGDGETGDIIQFTDSDGEVAQSALVIENYKGELLIAANTDDMYNFPSAATGFVSARVIKVYGYN